MMLSKLFAEERHKRGVTLREASEQCGVAFSTLSRLERGDGGISPRSAHRVRLWLDGVPYVPRPERGLRDQFAMAALTGLAARTGDDELSAQGLAHWAYAAADAMLAERDKGAQGDD